MDALLAFKVKSNGTRSAGTMKKWASKGSEHAEPFTTERLCGIWKKIRSDTEARRALKRLHKAGFRISRLKPSDATFKHPNWADYFAALPLLPNAPSTRRIHRKISFQKYWPLVRELRKFAAKVNNPFVEVGIFSKRDLPCPAIATIPEDLLKAASVLEHFLSWDYYERHRDRRKALLAELRWTIRQRTGRPHDHELNTLIDASFRAAGYKEGPYIDSTTLDRIEKRVKESRVKATRRIRDLIGPSPPSLQRSTRIHRNS